MKTSRQIVLELLTKMDKNGSYSNIILDNTFSREKLDSREKGFATALFYGVLERKMTLDYIIRYYSSMEFDKLSTEVVQLLRMGIYQLLYMNSVPQSAAVNETVLLAPKSAKGFVNAILRNFLRDGLKIDYKTLEGIGKLSIEYSCPKWLIKKWIAQFGDDGAEKILQSTFGRPPLFAKVNTLKCTAAELVEALKKEGVEARKNELLDDCVEIGRVQGVEFTNAYRRGLFHIQDISSQLCCKIARPMFNETVLDMCAAPGGKSFTMAEMMNNRGKLYSYDLYEGKVSFLREGAKRLGIDILTASANDATVFNEEIPQADKVLCDVVCSGLGVVRRKPEIKYKPMKELEEIPPIQKKILETCSRYVKLGGTLIYSTCTINTDENERIIEEFLQNNSDFAPIIVPLNIAGVPESHMRTFLPYITGGDGFFAATLRRIK